MIIVRVIIFQRAAVEITVSAGITRALPTKLAVVMIAKDGKDRHPMLIVWQMPQSTRMTHWTKPAVTVANTVVSTMAMFGATLRTPVFVGIIALFMKRFVVSIDF